MRRDLDRDLSACPRRGIIVLLPALWHRKPIRIHLFRNDESILPITFSPSMITCDQLPRDLHYALMSEPAPVAPGLSMILAIVFGFFLIFPVMWCAVCWISSQVGGWARLAKRYRSDLTPWGKSWNGMQGMVGFVSYRGVLDFHSNAEGLFLRPIAIFRFAHPLLFIPWDALHEVRRSSFLWLKQVSASVGSPCIARLRLPLQVFEGSEGREVLPPI